LKPTKKKEKNKMVLKSYSSFKTKGKKSKKKFDFTKKPLKKGITLALSFAALGLGLSALKRT